MPCSNTLAYLNFHFLYEFSSFYPWGLTILLPIPLSFCPCKAAFVVLSLDTLYVQFVWLWYSFEVWFGTERAHGPWSCVKQVIWFLIAWWLGSFTIQNHTSSECLRNPLYTRKIQVLKGMPKHICWNMCSLSSMCTLYRVAFSESYLQKQKAASVYLLVEFEMMLFHCRKYQCSCIWLRNEAFHSEKLFPYVYS